MEIVIDLLHLDKSIKELKAFEEDFDKKVMTTVEKAVSLGWSQAVANFKGAQYDGTNDVSVTARTKHKAGYIEASGKATLFIEFGTGVHYGNSHPNAYEFGYFPGSYGPNGLKEHWLYEGEPGTNGVPSTVNPKLVFTRGNPANRCMYNAGKAIETQIPKIVREVFK